MEWLRERAGWRCRCRGRVRWVVRLNDRVIDDDSYVLEQPLGRGEAMFLTVDLGDFLVGAAP